MPAQLRATSWKPCQPPFPPNFVNLMARYDQNWEMPGCRSRHIGQLRANPPPECCRSRRVSTDEANFTPIGGRNDQNHQGPLSKPPKISKIRNDTPQAPRHLERCVLYADCIISWDAGALPGPTKNWKIGGLGLWRHLDSFRPPPNGAPASYLSPGRHDRPP